MSTCPICNEPADKTCSACQSISYCSAAHQKQHWKTHKNSCTLYTIKTHERYGRQLLSTRDIKQGTVIFKEDPLAVGPKRLSYPLCVKCHVTVSGERFCDLCSLPLCPQCYDKAPSAKSYHTKFECDIFQKAKAKITDYNFYHPAYESLLPIRCLQLQQNGIAAKKDWDKLMTMAHNNEIRKSCHDIWHRNQVNVVDFLRKKCGLELDEETIHSIIGIIDVNAYEIKLNGVEICGVYRLGGLMNHDCKPNTIYIIDEHYAMIVMAAVDISKGQMISTSYADIFKRNFSRREYLKQTKYFDCVCKRCMDVTELGSFLSGVRCQSCSTGICVPDASNLFKCQSCDVELPSETISHLLDSIGKQIENTPQNIQCYEEILDKLKNTLHPNHYLLLPIVQALIKLYGRSKSYSYLELNSKMLQRKKDLCDQFLNVLDKLDVPMGRRRGATLYEFYISEYLLTKKLLETKEIGKEEYRQRLRAVIGELPECRRILSIDKMITNDVVSLVDILDDNIKCIMEDIEL